jgi:putative spermidine/putrescine transport system permease protein
VVILAALGGVLFMQRRRARHGSDAA